MVDVFFFFFFFTDLHICGRNGEKFAQNVVVCTFVGEMFAQMWAFAHLWVFAHFTAPHGLTVEFYKCFWKEIKDLVVGSLNRGFQQGELSLSQKQAVLTLLHTKKGPKTSLDNWWPVSLLNVDYKIAACVLSKRLKGVISKIVSYDQSGFMKNRSALESVRLVQDVIDFCELECIPGIIMSIDFKQAYDNVDLTSCGRQKGPSMMSDTIYTRVHIPCRRALA